MVALAHDGFRVANELLQLAGVVEILDDNGFVGGGRLVGFLLGFGRCGSFLFLGGFSLGWFLLSPGLFFGLA